MSQAQPPSHFIRRAVARVLIVVSLVVTGGCTGRISATPEAAHAADDPTTTDFADGAAASLPAVPTDTGPHHARVLDFAVFQAQVPVENDAAMAAVWTHLRETLFDRASATRLHENGLRVGVGNTGWWPDVRKALESVEGCRVTRSTPIRVPVDFQLSLELDAEPREQTLFVVGRDGVLSGGTWPESRNILRVVASPPRADASVPIAVTPELHQRLEGWQTVRSETGLYQVPRQNRVAFESASFSLELAADEYLLVAPAEGGRQGRLIGGAFLTREMDGRTYA